MIKQEFKSEYIDEYSTWRVHEKDYKRITAFILTLSESRKLKKNFEEVKNEILSKNVAIKNIKEPYEQELYYDEDEGYWEEDMSSYYSWWEMKKNGWIRKFRIYELEIKEGYELVLSEEN